MLKLSRLLKSIFRSVILLLLVLEVILLVSILLIYRNNTEQIKSGLQTNIKSGIINYRDLFVTYLANKYYMLSEDLIFLLRTFESILDNPNYPVNNNLTDIELNCMVNGNKILQIWNTSAYNPAWYDSPQENLASRLVGMWFTTRDQLTYDKLAPQDKYYIQAMCSISRIYKDILSKHLNWKDYFGVTNDQYYFAFSNSFFALFPSYNKPYMTSKAGEWTDTTRKLTCNTTRDINSYDPICRMYYQDVINANERLVISSPYRFASTGLYGKNY
jgi:hypothetical protein